MPSVTETRTARTQRIDVRNKFSATIGNNYHPKATFIIASYLKNVNIQYP